MSGHRRSLIAVAVTAIIASVQFATAAELADTVALDITAQSLDRALLRFSEQTGIQVLMSTDSVRGKTTQGVRGELTAERALHQLLEGSGLQFRSIDQRAVTIAVAERSSAARPITTIGHARVAQASLEDARAAQTPEPGMSLERASPPRGSVGSGNVEEIVVTGSHIRGVTAPVGSQLIVIDKDEIERAGFSSVRDISEALPQNFGGGATGELQPGLSNALNISEGTTLNLRGLGNVATLTLLNGRRIPAGGLNGTTSDISSIPLSLIERVEVLPDGASALYGSDAVAGVVNFILRKNYHGLETRARYGSTSDNAMGERLLSVAGGFDWSSGDALFGYEYFYRDRLRASDRSFTASRDMRAFGGDDNRQFFANPGNIVDPMTGAVQYAIPRDQDGRNLLVDNLLPPSAVNLNSTDTTYVDLFPQQERHSFFGSLRQQISDRLEMYVEGRLSARDTDRSSAPVTLPLAVPATNPYYIDVNGDGSPVYVAYSFEKDGGINRQLGDTRTHGAVLGLTVMHGAQWQTDAFMSYSSDEFANELPGSLNYPALMQALSASDPAQAFNPFGDGSFTDPQVLQRVFLDRKDLYQLQSEIQQVQVLTSGPLFDAFGNTVRAAVGIDARREQFKNELTTASVHDVTEVERSVLAAFGELNVPLVSATRARAGLYRFDLSASARYEEYRDEALLPETAKRPATSSFDPRIGLSWALLPDWTIRASYGTSFRAAELRTVSAPTTISVSLSEDPRSSTGFSNSMVIGGAQPDLKPESAETWSVGMDFALPIGERSSVQVSYFNISFEDQVTAAQLNFSDPALAARLIRNPTAAQVQAVCDLVDPALITQPEYCESPELVHVIADMRSMNYAKSFVDGIDMSFSSSFDIGEFGTLKTGVNATYLLSYEQTAGPRVDPVDLLNLPLYPVDLKARGHFTWIPSHALSVSAFVNYTDSYWDSGNKRRVGSWTTLDLSASFDLGRASGSATLKDLTLQLSGSNVFDQDPPFHQNWAGLGYDPSNSDPLGRFIALTVTKRW